MIKVTLPDGSVREFSQGVTPMDVAKNISEGFARNVISANYNDTTIETSTPLTTDGKLTLYTWNDKEGKKAFWHSSSHVMAQTLEEMYSGIKLTLGPAIDNGFYYDVDFGDNKITDADFKKIEDRVLEISREKHEFKMRAVTKAEALDKYKDNEYKTELISNLEDGTITFCDHATFTDLCRGGHIPNTGIIKAVKIMSIAGAYWRGDEKNKQLTRVYGTSFPKQKDLTDYLELLEEAKRRDHRKLGKELDLFHFSQRVGQGLPLWLPKGAALRDRLEQFLKKAQKKAGYEQVVTPHIGQKELYVTSGHYEKYGADSFQSIQTPKDGEEFLLKPMNCPHHCEIYNAKPFSYKELPKRFAEFGTVYRYEQSGELHGLTRVRGFTQDDAHIFCTPDQLNEEFQNVIDLVLYVFGSLGFENFSTQVSVRDPENSDKYIGASDVWDKAEQAIINAAEAKGLDYIIETGEAAFYGPKVDIQVRTAMGHVITMSTVQLDFLLPERFDLQYIGSDGEKHRPVVIHRGLISTWERLMSILLEQYKGAFPTWLAPVQIKLIPVNLEMHEQYAKKLHDLFIDYDFRSELDLRDEKLGYKIRDAQTSKIPYQLVVGDNEVDSNQVTYRRYGETEQVTVTVEEFIDMISKEIRTKGH